MTNMDRNLPLQEPTFYILLSLRGGEKHGYAILKDVADISCERFTVALGIAMVVPILGRFPFAYLGVYMGGTLPFSVQEPACRKYSGNTYFI